MVTQTKHFTPKTKRQNNPPTPLQLHPTLLPKKQEIHLKKPSTKPYKLYNIKNKIINKLKIK